MQENCPAPIRVIDLKSFTLSLIVLRPCETESTAVGDCEQSTDSNVPLTNFTGRLSITGFVGAAGLGGSSTFISLGVRDFFC